MEEDLQTWPGTNLVQTNKPSLHSVLPNR
jgi:hypothetical protein